MLNSSDKSFASIGVSGRNLNPSNRWFSPNRALLDLRGFWRLPGKQNFQNQQSRPNHNRAIRKIKNRPLILLYVNQQKIHHAAAGKAVPQISQRSAHDEGQTNAGGDVSIII